MWAGAQEKKKADSRPFFFVVLCACAFTIVSAAAVTAAAGRDAGCVEGFPESFYVSTGTTIPLTGGAAPIAQSGNLFVDGMEGRVRMDQFYLGRQHSFILDRKKRRAYMFENDVPDAKKKGNTNCHVFSTVGDAITLCIPTTFTQDSDRPHLVRGVPVRRYRGFDRQEGPLLRIDHYVLNATLADLGAAGARVLLIPWRVQTWEQPGAELKEIAGAPLSMPNWRYFGQPMFDEVDFPLNPRDPSGDEEVVPYSSESRPVTVDFYNFVPVTPDAGVFAVPDACRQAEESWESATGDPHTDSRGTADADARRADSLLHLSFAHRLLIDWSVSLTRQHPRVEQPQ